MVDTNEAYKPSQRWILLVGLRSLVWARLKTVCLTTILGLENNNCFPTLKSLPATARLPVISQSKLFSTRQHHDLHDDHWTHHGTSRHIAAIHARPLPMETNAKPRNMHTKATAYSITDTYTAKGISATTPTTEFIQKT